MEMMYRFFVNLVQPGASAGIARGTIGNVEGANPMALIGNNYAKLYHDYTSLRGNPFLGTEDATEVEK